MESQVFINKVKCKGCGSCEEVSPDAFKMDESFEKAEFVGHGEKIEKEVLEQAAAICPTKCIEIE